MSAKRIITLAISAVICGGYLLVGLWPFEFHPRNNLGWRPGASGTVFGYPSIIYSEGWFDFGGAGRGTETNAVTIELYLQSEHKPGGEVGSILTFYDGDLPENLLVAQWKGEVLLRVLARDLHGQRLSREVGVEAGLGPGARRFIAIVSSAAGASFYMDGVRIREIPGLSIRPEALRGRIVLGNAPQGNRRWAGKLYCVAIFNRSLSAGEMTLHYRLWTRGHLLQLQSEQGLTALYLMGERDGATIPDRSPSGTPLLVPEHFQVLRKTVLVPPWEDPHPWFSDTGDVLINVLGFIPFGFFFFAYLSQVGQGYSIRSGFLTVAAAGIISLVIELIQVYIPTRSSSLTDFICNISGAAVGVILGFLVGLVFRRPIPTGR